MKKYFAAFFFAVVLCGCATPVTQPRSFADSLAYSYAAVTSYRLAAADALTNGVITVEQAQHAQAVADEARTLLDAAKAAHDVGNDAGGQMTLAQATAALVTLQGLLDAKIEGGAK